MKTTLEKGVTTPVGIAMNIERQEHMVVIAVACAGEDVAEQLKSQLEGSEVALVIGEHPDGQHRSAEVLPLVLEKRQSAGPSA